MIGQSNPSLDLYCKFFTDLRSCYVDSPKYMKQSSLVHISNMPIDLIYAYS